MLSPACTIASPDRPIEILVITVANELDVLAHNPELADRYGPSLYQLFFRVRDLLPTAAWQACAAQLGPQVDPQSSRRSSGERR
ncbi:hypothetical protein [Kitasatospora sp. NPDC058190]|uniref:hypothetical protein n=1 Tax=Kitasatospora sp. NPDC058190 TaxID=3346371 RepID=UPI0036D83984